jgi:hypothetical protein
MSHFVPLANRRRGGTDRDNRRRAFNRVLRELAQKRRVEISPSGFVRRILPGIDPNERFTDDMVA